MYNLLQTVQSCTNCSCNRHFNIRRTSPLTRSADKQAIFIFAEAQQLSLWAYVVVGSLSCLSVFCLSIFIVDDTTDIVMTHLQLLCFLVSNRKQVKKMLFDYVFLAPCVHVPTRCICSGRRTFLLYCIIVAFPQQFYLP